MPDASPSSVDGRGRPEPDERLGLLTGVSAYGIWGLFPLLFNLLKPAAPLEILAHRIVWSLVFVTVLLVALRRPWGWLPKALSRERAPWAIGASVLIAVNWLTYIWAVTSGHVVEASLGYFINPLVNVALGRLLFGERISRGGLAGVLLALAGVSVIAWENWSGLWVSLLLAFSFGLYGAVKKRATTPALEGLFLESVVLAPVAVGYLVWLGVVGAGQFGASAGGSGMLLLAGVLTAVPLWLFAIAASNLPYSTVGMLQYLAPTIQFLLGLFVFGETVTASYWAGLVLVWMGSATYLGSALRR